ncbi:MAG: T9SS-dependent M36 family metallopeptidase [Bacteroidia bacterium]|jgi:hypothetical protein
MKRLIIVFLALFSTSTGFAQYSNDAVRTLYLQKAASFGLTADDVKSCVITSQYTEKTTGITHIYTRQVVQGREIFDANSAIHLDRNGNVITWHNRFYANADQKINATQPVVQPVQALQNFAQQIDKAIPTVVAKAGVSAQGVLTIEDTRISPEPVNIKAYYLGQESGLKLVWNVELFDNETGDWWNARVDALTGEILERNNWTVHCDPAVIHEGVNNHAHENHFLQASDETSGGTYGKTGEGQYYVLPLPIENPQYGEHTIKSGSATTNGSPFGWHDTDGVAGPDFTITRGNNVFASEDTSNKNIPGYSPNGGVNLTFDFPYNVRGTKQQNTNASITNVFYWNNLIHDIFYNYGFDEVAGNFQSNNYGKGGTALDPVRADAMDGSGTNNANFASPVDGKIPRMQMYMWTNGEAGDSNLIIHNSSNAGTFNAPQALFGPPILTDISGQLMLAIDGSSGNTACNTITNDLTGKIALLYRGSSCNYLTKVTKAQEAGAIAVIVVNNNSFPPSSMSGSGAGLTIPAVMISKTLGDNLRSNLLADSIYVTLLGDSDAYALFDSDLDNAVITHEYGHGISNRLTGGPANSSCLGNTEQAGEGWSDFFGLCLTSKASDSTRARGIGTWLSGQDSLGLGIRPFRYSKNMSINPMTYNYIKSVSVPHGVGSVWCTMLYDLYWDMVDKYGFNPDLYQTDIGGNNKMLQLVVDGLKYQPCNPGFVDSRNAIILADSIRNGGANKALLWKGFARRGLGYSANQASSLSATDGSEGYNLPPDLNSGLNEATAWQQIHVYPNPAKDRLNIALPDMAGNVNIELFDIAGKRVLSQAHTIDLDARIELALTQIEKGMYILRISNGALSYQTKVVVE